MYRKWFETDLTRNVTSLDNSNCINTTRRTRIIRGTPYRGLRIINPNCKAYNVTTGNGLCQRCWDKACGTISANMPEDAVPFGN